jgi:TRAP-type C4-dicarboxylate transport system substrate-binding protein
MSLPTNHHHAICETWGSTVMSQATYDSLSDEQKAAVDECALQHSATASRCTSRSRGESAEDEGLRQHCIHPERPAQTKEAQGLLNPSSSHGCWTANSKE